MSKIGESLLSQDEKTLDVAEAGPIWSKNAFLCIKKDVGVPTVQLVQPEAADKETEEEETHVTRSRPTRKRTTKPDQKGKDIASSPKKAKKTKVPRFMKSRGEKGNYYLVTRPPQRKQKYTSNSNQYLEKYFSMNDFNSFISIRFIF